MSTAVDWEQCEWSADLDHLSRRQRERARGTYRAAIPAQIATLEPRVPVEVSAEAEDALIEISRFDAELAGVLPAEHGERAPLPAVLLRTESASSSQIEGITAGAKALALATLHEATRKNAQLVAANVQAMQRAVDLADNVSSEAVLAMHEVLMRGEEYALPGQLRAAQVWIGAGPTPHTAVFVPPRGERVPAALEDLVAFCRRTDVPVLTQVAVAHAQFETIHPFNDGNGRTGRALVHALLRHAGTTRRLTVPVSAGLFSDTTSYFDALTVYRDGDPAPIVREFTRASLLAVRTGRRLVGELSEILDSWLDRLPSRRGSAAQRLLPHLLSQPAVNIKHVQEHLEVSQPAAKRAVDQLEASGILTQVSTAKRNRVWVATDVTGALDDFARRAGRRM